MESEQLQVFKDLFEQAKVKGMPKKLWDRCEAALSTQHRPTVEEVARIATEGFNMGESPHNHIGLAGGHRIAQALISAGMIQPAQKPTVDEVAQVMATSMVDASGYSSDSPCYDVCVDGAKEGVLPLAQALRNAFPQLFRR